MCCKGLLTLECSWLLKTAKHSVSKLNGLGHVFKVPLLWVMKVHIWFWIPNNRLNGIRAAQLIEFLIAITIMDATIT